MVETPTQVHPVPALPKMIYRHDFRAMGSLITVMMELADDVRSEQIPNFFSNIEELFTKWEEIFSRFTHNSEVSKLNRNAGRPIPVSEPMMEMLQIARNAEYLSDGLVRATLYEQVCRAGYDRSLELISTIGRSSAAPTVWQRNASTIEIVLDTDHYLVTLPYDVRVDLNGFVKGWAAKQIVEKVYPNIPTLISAGGDMAVNKPHSSGNWHVTIEDPFDDIAPIANLGIPSGSIATSGTYKRNWLMDGTRQHHIIDPRTGFPASTDLVSVTVVSKDGILPEIAAKTVLILGSKRGLDWLSRHHDCAAFLIMDDGHAVFTDNMEQYFWSN